MASIQIKKLEKTYDNGFKAVHGIDLDIKEGEFMVFVGPSGCAKSTTLRMIAGLESVTSGDILIGDTRVNDTAPKDRGIAMVFQNYALYPQMTAYQNMAFGLKMKGVPKPEIDQRVKEAASKLEIEDLLDRTPKDMSGGQRQRVAVGRAIVRKPDVFLFDEPLSNLDAKLRVSMRIRITSLHKQLKQEGIPATMIYVTHDQTEAMTMGDRICVMKEGQIMQVDTPVNLYNHPKNSFVATFIGSPSMNLIPATLASSQGDVHHFKTESGAEIHLNISDSGRLHNYIGSKVEIGVRPEDISISEEGQLPVGITAIEQMGNEQFVYFSHQCVSLVARLSPDLKGLTIGHKASLSFDGSKCHIFDANSGDNLLLNH
ncbi:sn-glycerol-3-phosphate ABC transporter ATP-binding protein UgpC [Vibrio cholerae]